MISLFKPCLVNINNLEWNSIWILEIFNNPINLLIHICNFKSLLLKMNALFSKQLRKCFHNQVFCLNELSFNVFKIKLFIISI